jgi:(S)-ureidoglycine aminohydrolase
MPLEGFPYSRLPNFPDAQVRVLASPALGAQFVQYRIDLPAGSRGSFAADERIETFFFVLGGEGILTEGRDANYHLAPDDYALFAPARTTTIVAKTPLSLIILRKRYEPAPGIETFGGIFGSARSIKKEIWADNPHSQLQTLIPDDIAYDMAMNIFTFDPGHGLPVVETHVMEHGLYFLQGKGLYHLAGEWMEVERDDYIWMGPYCPQSFYATGPTPAKYLYYKNVNREIPL